MEQNIRALHCQQIIATATGATYNLPGAFSIVAQKDQRMVLLSIIPTTNTFVATSEEPILIQEVLFTQYRPAFDLLLSTSVINEGAPVNGTCRIGTDGTIAFFVNTNAPFTQGNFVGVDHTVSVVYPTEIPFVPQQPL